MVKSPAISKLLRSIFALESSNRKHLPSVGSVTSEGAESADGAGLDSYLKSTGKPGFVLSYSIEG